MDKTKKITCIIQARTGSKRLANKVLKEIEDTPVICHIINRIKRSRNVEQIICDRGNLQYFLIQLKFGCD